MEVKNFTEEIVVKRLRELLEKKENICKCETCYADMVAFALNGLSARTYVSKEGAIYRELETLGDDFKLKIVEKCILAISKISSNPRHKIENEQDWGNKDGSGKTSLRSRKKEQFCSHYYDR